MGLFAAGAAGTVVDAGADPPAAFVWADAAEHDNMFAVIFMTAFALKVMFTSFTRFTFSTPGIQREGEGHGYSLFVSWISR